MRYYPNLNTFDLFSDTSSSTSGLLRTDIKEKDGMYEIEMEMPGIKKEDIQIELSQGNLKISATRKQDSEESGKYVRKERFVGTISRSFYLGDGYKQEDVKAKFKNGILCLTLPTEITKEEETKQWITIE